MPKGKAAQPRKRLIQRGGLNEPDFYEFEKSPAIEPNVPEIPRRMTDAHAALDSVDEALQNLKKRLSPAMVAFEVGPEDNLAQESTSEYGKSLDAILRRILLHRGELDAISRGLAL